MKVAVGSELCGASMRDEPGAVPSLLVGRAALTVATEVWSCHQQAFGDDGRDYASWYSELFAKHAQQAGHRLVLVREGDTVTGYGWGHVGHRGEYWSDLLCESLPERISAAWVGGHFDVVELAVLASHRRRGLGQALHDRLLDGVTRKCLLATNSDPDSPAVHLYARSGWKTLGLLRPGMQVMGLDRS